MERFDRRTLLVMAAAGAVAPRSVLRRSPTDRALRQLEREVVGPVVSRGEPGYKKGRLLWNTRFDAVLPRAIVYCANTEDVQRTVHWARRNGVRIVPRAGGHSYAGYSTVRDGVVVDVSRIDRVQLRANQTAVVGAGAALIDVYTALAAGGRTIPAGSCATVGIAGLTLGGGHGYSGRKLGLTSDNLLGVTIVDARGRALTCSEREHADLFWACRGGGGGNFGIATSFRFRTHPVDRVSVYSVRWPWANARDVVDAWQAWAPHAPEELFSLLFLAASGGAAGPAITSGGQFFGTESDLRSLLAPLVSVGAPIRVSVESMTYLEAVQRFAGNRARLTFKAKSNYANEPLSPTGVAALLNGLEARSADSTAGRGQVIFDAYGGAINRVPAGATAFVHRSALFSIQYEAIWSQASAARRNLAWIDALHAAMRAHVSGFAYQNYIDPALATWKSAYYGSNLRRLVAVKRRYDPRNMFRFRQSIPTRL
jgi:FAD/FMN-containing dehydrogenase